jgi:hypothetical protein
MCALHTMEATNVDDRRPTSDRRPQAKDITPH